MPLRPGARPYFWAVRDQTRSGRRCTTLIILASGADQGRKVSVLAIAVRPAWRELAHPLHGASCCSDLQRIALAWRLSEASETRRSAFSRHCSSRKISTAQLARQKLHRLVTQKPAERPQACAPPSIAGQGPAGLPAKPGLAGKRGRAKLARIWTTGPSTATFFWQNYRSCSGPPWTLRLSQFCVQGNRVRLRPNYQVRSPNNSVRVTVMGHWTERARKRHETEPEIPDVCRGSRDRVSTAPPP